MDKKMYKYIGVLVGLILLLVLVLYVSNNLLGGGKLTYQQVESKLVSAAKNYVKDHPGYLPSFSNESTIISGDALVTGGYMKSPNDYLNISSGVICYANVEVYNIGDGGYNYVPSLTCGDSYQSIRLADKVIVDNEFGINEGSGLYVKSDGYFVDAEGNYDNTEYVFRGEGVNNYVQIDDNLWRIVSINENNEILLIFNGHIQKTSAWDDRYNEDVKKNQGINDYEANGLESRAKEMVMTFYKGEAILNNRENYSDKTKFLLSPMDLCIGKRSPNNEDKTSSLECRTILEDQYVGLLPAYAYMEASLDDNCTHLTSKNCGNYNYLSEFNDYWWLLTANSENTNETYNVATKFVESTLCSYRSNIRPTVLLGSRVIFNEGSGSLVDPYTVKYVE